jgi:PAS domain-containing protein
MDSRSTRSRPTIWLGGIITVVVAAPVPSAWATTPCGGLEECRAIVEINATDGDIGFHWLADAKLIASEIFDSKGRRVFANQSFGPLREQTLTETFGESSEPVCRLALAEEPDEDVVTLQQFLRRWPAGPYEFRGLTADFETVQGQTALTHWLPAAPRNVQYRGGVISWEPGGALGVCATQAELWKLVNDGRLPIHPMHVPVAAWEVTLELDDDSGRTLTLRLPARGPLAQTSVSVPIEFLNSIAPDTRAKIEVGAIGGRLEIGDDDNATFTVLTGLCLNRDNGCEAPD